MSSSRKPTVIRRSGLEPSKMEVAEKPAVSDDDIAKVIGYCKYYFRAAAAAEATGNIEKFEAKLDKRNGDISSRLNSVAESMEMDRGHLDLTCQAVADMLKTKSVEEILEVFAIKDGEFTPEEEEEMRKEIQRALE